MIERAARYQERTAACLKAGRRSDGRLERSSIERALVELSAAIDCLWQATELAEAQERDDLESALRRREEERRSLETLLRR